MTGSARSDTRRAARDVIPVTIPRDRFVAWCLEQAGRIDVPADAVHGYTINADDDALHVLLVVDAGEKRPTNGEQR